MQSAQSKVIFSNWRNLILASAFECPNIFWRIFGRKNSAEYSAPDDGFHSVLRISYSLFRFSV